jgi:hypothetical protein
VLACQPFNYPATNFNIQLEPVTHAVGTFPLCHVYVETSAPVRPRHVVTDDNLGQVIAVKPQMLMVYAGGAVADYHNNAFTHHRRAYRKDLERRLAEHVPGVRIGKVVVHYWPHAVSFWHANAAGAPLVAECVVPHPTKLPGLVCVGEQFSTEQGWAEGALESCDVALDYLLDGRVPFRRLKRLPVKCIAYDDRIIDVADWLRRHPGGAAAIRAHMQDGDAALTFRAVHGHAPYALRHLLSLQIGFLK